MLGASGETGAWPVKAPAEEEARLVGPRRNRAPPIFTASSRERGCSHDDGWRVFQFGTVSKQALCKASPAFAR